LVRLRLDNRSNLLVVMWIIGVMNVWFVTSMNTFLDPGLIKLMQSDTKVHRDWDNDVILSRIFS
jgi:hypothetical protein